MKPLVYFLIFFLVVPLQASLFDLFSVGGVKPDLALALLYIIGLLSGPVEATLAGIAVGLVQDISSASLLGLNGFTRGLFGLAAGFLGRGVLDISSPSNIIFLTGFCAVEGLVIALFLQIFYGDVPFFSMFFTRMLPQALYTGLLGTILLHFVAGKKAAALLLRRPLQKE